MDPKAKGGSFTVGVTKDDLELIEEMKEILKDAYRPDLYYTYAGFSLEGQFRIAKAFFAYMEADSRERHFLRRKWGFPEEGASVLKKKDREGSA